MEENTRPANNDLLDRSALRREFGITRSTIDHVLRNVPIISLPGSRKVLVRRADVEALLEEHTYAPGADRVRP